MRYEGSCHCGRIEFDVEGEFTSGMECNCSICRRRGSILGFVPRSDLHLKTPDGNASTYTFNTHRLQHRFCPTCGVAPYAEGKGPDGSEMAAINLRCIPSIDLAALQMTMFDGASR
jgi:hypothetical protein